VNIIVSLVHSVPEYTLTFFRTHSISSASPTLWAGLARL
jgi:hypothetical protein